MTLEESDKIKSLLCIKEYKLDCMYAVKEAEQTPTTALISQVFGGLMSKHADMRERVPACLTGCVDAIYAYNLFRLHTAANASAAGDDLVQLIRTVLEAQRADMRGEVCKEQCDADRAG